MATGRVPTTANSPLTAKGDLFTYSTAPARLAVGNNGESLVADSSTAAGLRYQGSQAAGKNTIINGGMDIWQRGTSFPFVAGELYTADRWYVFRGGFVTGATLSRQNSALNYTRYCSRMQRDSGNTSTQPLYATYTMETQDSIGYAGQTIVFSFYARAGANYSGGAFTGRVLYGTGTDQRVTTFTGIGVTTSVSATLTTSWQRFQGTATVSASATEIGFDFAYTPTGTASTNDYVEFTGVQFELGSVATTFQRAGGTLQGELAACQRYYNRITPSTGAYEVLGSGYAISTTVTTITVPFPVSMRIKPTSAETTGTAANYAVLNGAGGVVACSVVPAIDSQNTNLTGLLSATVASGLTAGQGTQLRANNTTAAYIGWSAEL